MNILPLLRKEITKLCLALACLLALPSCGGWIYDEEGDCTVYYRLNFCYDMNLKWADAFANEVTSVHVYAFDKTGLLAWQKSETVDPSTAKNYSMLLELAPGDYTLMAWCGLVNEGEGKESFDVPEATVGVSRIEQIQCSLNRERDEAGAYSNKRLFRLFHGMKEVTLPTNDDGGTYEYTINLTKNTNHIRVILHQLSGEDLDVGQFTFSIDEENGLMAHSNDLLPDENINYRPWATQSGVAGVGKPDVRSIIQVKGGIADFTVGRMHESHRDKMMLTITNSDHKTVANIPIIDYALLGKEYYEQEYKHKMTDQEFLDREDDYVMTFFLDENNKWVSSEILIHSWHVIISEHEVD